MGQFVPSIVATIALENKALKAQFDTSEEANRNLLECLLLFFRLARSVLTHTVFMSLILVSDLLGS